MTRADLDILLDYAHRMDFRDQDGAPLIAWRTPEEAFEAWKSCSAGRPCDYSGLSYAKLVALGGVPWPCNEAHPRGTPRLYEDLVFATDPSTCQTFGHDLQTGGRIGATEYRARMPAGRALLKSAHYHPPVERPDADYPFMLTTGRLTYRLHTRTKTGRSPELNRAAPEVYVEMAASDVARLGLREGDMVRITSRRGTIEAAAKIGDILEGHAFVPFHYGYWDDPGRARAANELTVSSWDPVSKQPRFEFAAVRLSGRSAPGRGASAGPAGPA